MVRSGSDGSGWDVVTDTPKVSIDAKQIRFTPQRRGEGGAPGTGPEDARVAQEDRPPRATRTEAVIRHDDLSPLEHRVEHPVEPPSDAQPGPAEHRERPARKDLRPLQTVPHKGPRAAQPVPKAPDFASTGLMAAPDPGIVARNGMVLAAAGGIGLVVVLGLGAAVLLGGKEAPPRAAHDTALAQSDAIGAAVAMALEDTATDAQTPVSGDVSDVPRGTQPLLSAPARAFAAAVPSDAGGTAAGGSGPQTLQALREAVLARAYAVTTMEREGVTRVVLQLLDGSPMTGDDVGYFLATLEAQSPGSAASLRTPEGGIDVETLVFRLVQSSLMQDGDPLSVAAAREMSRAVFAAATARTQAVGAERIYTVQRGDSLAYIALQFYGMPDAYRQILDANPDTLQPSEQIQLGQRLTIPG